MFLLDIKEELLSYFPLPYIIDLFGGNFFTNYPVSLDVVEPALSIPVNVLIGKVIYALIGFIMIMIASIPQKKNNC